MSTVVSNISVPSNSNLVRLPYQHSSFYAAKRFWVFYNDGEHNLYYKTSLDGVSWSSAIYVTHIIHASAGFDVYFDGIFIHFARNLTSVGVGYHGLRYRRGTPQSDGSITWSTTEQSVLDSSKAADDVSLSVDSAGYPWMCYARFNTRPQVIKSSENDGHWTMAPDFPHTFPHINYFPVALPQTGGKMCCLMYSVYTPHQIEFYPYNGTWGSKETATSSNVKTVSVNGYYGMLSATSIGDDIHLVFHSYPANNLVYVQRINGVWGSETIIESSKVAAKTSPIISHDSNGNLYIFWIYGDKIYYKRGDSSGNWDAEATELIDESINGLPSGSYQGINNQAYFQTYKGYMALTYLAYPSSPFDIKHKIVSSFLDSISDPTISSITANRLFSLRTTKRAFISQTKHYKIQNV